MVFLKNKQKPLPEVTYKCLYVLQFPRMAPAFRGDLEQLSLSAPAWLQVMPALHWPMGTAHFSFEQVARVAL